MLSDRITAAVFVVCALLWLAGGACVLSAVMQNRRAREKKIDWELDFFMPAFFISILGFPAFAGMVRAAIFAVTGR